MFDCQISLTQVLTLLGSVSLIYYILTYYLHRSKSTPLRGPSFKNYFFGHSKTENSPELDEVYERWAEEYGSVYCTPDLFWLGMSTVFITDPKALAHFYTRETFGYVQPEVLKMMVHNMIGPGLFYTEGEAHRRQRKALSPAFSNVAIRKILPIFFDSAYELKSQWDNIIDSSGALHTVIEVQQWMNRISLDVIGRAGFSHAFNSLSNPSSISDVQRAFDSFSTTEPSLAAVLAIFVGCIFPVALRAPTNYGRIISKVKETTAEIGEGLLARTKLAADKEEEKSIIGMLIKTENSDAELHMTQEEVLAQVGVFLLAGYETTSIILTWTLIELSNNPNIQDRLRTELLQDFPTSDPSWDQLTNASALPYLDAVVHEVLRLHSPVLGTLRITAEDDILPLSTPLRTPSGSLVNDVHITKGTFIVIPTRCINRSTAFWGEDSKVFKPQRWLDGGVSGGDNGRWQELPGYRHILTFADGPRACLGRGFALAEIKAVLSVLIRNYSFAFPGDSEKGVNPEIEIVKSILLRPKIKGQDGIGACVALKVEKIEY